MTDEALEESYNEILERLKRIEEYSFSSNMTWDKVNQQRDQVLMNTGMIALYGNSNFNYNHWVKELVNNFKVIKNSTLNPNKHKPPKNSDILKLILSDLIPTEASVKDLIDDIIKHEKGTVPFYDLSTDQLRSFITHVLKSMLNDNNSVLDSEYIKLSIELNINILNRTTV